jgi:hypothetical protein
VRSRNIGTHFGAGLKSLVGGELKGMTQNRASASSGPADGPVVDLRRMTTYNAGERHSAHGRRSGAMSSSTITFGIEVRGPAVDDIWLSTGSTTLLSGGRDSTDTHWRRSW